MSTQDRTLDHYQELMTINATAHILRAARQLGLLDQLREGQKTVETLSERLQIPGAKVLFLLETLIPIGMVEQYQDDYALSSTARLLCQYDADLDDATWEQLADSFQGESRSSEEQPSDSAQPVCGVGSELRNRFDSIAATQWVHTPAAMQAAEILDLGPSMGPDLGASLGPDTVLDRGGEAALATTDEGDTAPIRLLDLGCGSAVWSCAIGYREKSIEITAIDSEAALASATATATSIGLTDRFRVQIGDVLGTPIDEASFDVVVIAQRLHAFSDDQIGTILRRAWSALRAGGKLVVIDSFVGPNRPSLAESLERLRLQIQTPSGEVPDIKRSEHRFHTAGFERVQFTFIAASRIGLGLMTGVKP